MNSTEQVIQTEIALLLSGRKVTSLRANLTGRQFGHLTVLSYAGRRGKYNKHYWRCRCDCGSETLVCQNELLAASSKKADGRSGTTSCGCTRRGNKSKNWKGYGKISGHYWYDLKYHAVRRKLPFDITIQQAWELLVAQKMTCALSGLPITTGGYEDNNQTCSLDRIDNSKGYTIDNVQWLHKEVNMMKHVHNQEHFVGLCKCIADHQTRSQPGPHS